mmetsp:Transcript_251/g.548  ORF Transcript_251/g.548 Transcript_251/m.548 type:complete len:377 (-) Transcript_251:78-1208(-)
MSSTRAGPGMPPGTSSGHSVATTRQAAPALSCNLCNKPLVTTCFLCACDCVFCEECTYSHFENSSQCPTCRRTLGENDFTELVVADNNGSDISKMSMQALFSKKSRSGNLQYSDICQSLIQQIDVSKQSTKFLLKQLLVESHKSGRTSMVAARAQESLKAENTHLKQLNSSQRLQYEQTISELQNKLKAREGTITELNQMLNKFRQYHGGGGGGSSGRGGGSGSSVVHMNPNSSAVSIVSARGGPEPPLRGLMKQREASMQAQQNAMNGGKRPFMNNMNNMNNMNRNKSPGANFRPFSSSNSSGGGSIASNAPRIRDLTANSGYHFTGIPNQNMNKRRRGNTPTSLGAGTPHAMSPNTAFALNQGPHGRNIFQGPR